MASIAIKSNLSQVITHLRQQLETVLDKNYLLRPVAFEVLPMLTERIHKEGKASDGSQIGTYSSGYLKQRERNKRGSNPKVIVSYTRQLENDWSVLETRNGYGIGFTNPFNAEKLHFVEEIKGKQIGFLTETELDFAFDRVNELIQDAINK